MRETMRRVHLALADASSGFVPCRVSIPATPVRNRASVMKSFCCNSRDEVILL